MKTVREYYQQCLQTEKAAFLKVMKAVPADKADYKPDPRSTSARDLVGLLAFELEDACELIDRGELSFDERASPDVDASIAAYEKNFAALEARLLSLDDGKWESKAKLTMGGRTMWETTLGDMLFGFLFDAVHHRGQLSSYLRPMGAKVPSIYGPSADDPGQ